jgi:glycosyltransferase involved in cell wall biosynthesis
MPNLKTNNREIVHVVFNTFVNDSRVLKQVRTISQNFDYLSVNVAALWEPGLSKTQVLEPNINVKRFKLLSRRLPKFFILKPLKFLEALIRVTFYYSKSNPAIIHCHDLPALPLGLMFKLFLGTFVIYDAHEWETEQSPGQSAWKSRFLYFLENFLIRFADRVITVSPSIALKYKDVYNIELPTVVLNSPKFKALSRKRLFHEEFGLPSETKVFLYQGAFTEGRNLLLLADAFKSLKRSDLSLVYMGYGPLYEPLKRIAKDTINIHIRDAVNPDEVLDYTASADFGIALGDSTCTSFYLSLPNKIFEYTMAGLPVLMAPLFEFCRIEREFGIGMTVREVSKGSIMAAIEQMADSNVTNYSERLVNFSKIHCWENQEKNLLVLYGS